MTNTPHVHNDLGDIESRVRAFREADEATQLKALAELHRRIQGFASSSMVAAVAVSASVVTSMSALLVGLYTQDKQWLLATAQRFDTLALAAANQQSSVGERATKIAGELYEEAAVNVFLASVEPLAVVAVALLTVWVVWVGWRSRRRAVAAAWVAVYERPEAQASRPLRRPGSLGAPVRPRLRAGQPRLRARPRSAGRTSRR